MNVKLLIEDGELYVLVHSDGRLLKERGMRRRHSFFSRRRQEGGGPGLEPGRHPRARDRQRTRRR